MMYASPVHLIHSRKQRLMKCSLVTEWTCDVCKSYPFDTLEEAEAHEKQYRVPPSRRGRKLRKIQFS